jgi:hypothetical protein
MNARLVLTTTAVWAMAMAMLVAAAATDSIRVTPVVSDGQVSASFDAPTVFDTDAQDLVRSGLLLTFTFNVELRRPSSVWMDHVLGTTTVASSVKFDNLTGVYQVSKVQDGRVFWSERTQEATQVRTWMTAFDKVALGSREALEPNADYYVRVRMQASPRRTFSFWPWSSDAASGRADFTFIR